MEKLISANVLSQEIVKNTIDNHTALLNKALKESMEDVSRQSDASYLTGRWTGMKQAEANITRWDTGVDLRLLQFLGKKSVQVPSNLVSKLIVSNNVKYIFFISLLIYRVICKSQYYSRKILQKLIKAS